MTLVKIECCTGIDRNSCFNNDQRESSGKNEINYWNNFYCLSHNRIRNLFWNLLQQWFWESRYILSLNKINNVLTTLPNLIWTSETTTRVTLSTTTIKTTISTSTTTTTTTTTTTKVTSTTCKLFETHSSDHIL